MKSRTRVQYNEHNKEIAKQVTELTNLGVVKPFNGEFYSQVLLIRKPDQSLGFCIDFWFLNHITADIEI